MSDTATIEAVENAEELKEEVAEEIVDEIADEIADEVEVEYELRPLVATDMGKVCKIITAIGIRQFRECFEFEGDIENISLDCIGFGVVFDIAGIVISNIPKAEEEIQTFISSLTGMKLSEVEQMPFADYGSIIMQIVMKKEFRDFFKRVMKLFKR